VGGQAKWWVSIDRSGQSNQLQTDLKTVVLDGNAVFLLLRFAFALRK